MALAQVVEAAEEAIVGTTKSATRTVRRRGRNITRAQKRQVAKNIEAKETQAATQDVEEAIIENPVSEPVVAEKRPYDPSEHTPEARRKAAEANQAYKDEANAAHEKEMQERYSREPKPSKSLDSMMFRKKAGASKGEAHMYDSTNNQLAADLNAMSDPLAKKSIGEAYGIKNHESMTNTQFKNAVRDHHSQRIKAGPKTMDHLMGHKVPQKAGGLLVTAGVVSSLSGSRGQQSNAQLYGQAPMPGM
jgi:hypothetical protein